MKRKILLPLLLLCVGSFVGAVACKKSKPAQTPVGTTVMLNKEEISIDVYQEYWLIADYDGEETPVWTVADPEIVSVEAGKLVGLKAGTTTVTVQIGSFTDTCTVTVNELGIESYSLTLSKPNISLYKDEQHQIEAAVTCEGRKIDVIQRSYVSANPEIVSVDDNGRLTAKAYGNATISVLCSVDGKELSGTVNVRVIANGKVEIQQSVVELDVSPENKTTTLTAKVYDRGIENTSATVEWSVTEGQDVISLTNGTVTALNAGETTVTASYVDGDGQRLEDSIVVTVASISVDTRNSILVFKDECTDGYQLDTSLLGEGVGDITGGYVVSAGGLKTMVQYADGRYVVSPLSTGIGDLYVQTRNVEYRLEMELWSAKLSNEVELREHLTGASAVADGWYQLDEDITVTDQWTYGIEMQFNGLFDGKDHTISFATNTGLFDTLTRNATVKNVTLDATVNAGGALAREVETGSSISVENVNVYADVWGTGNAGLIAVVSGALSVKNVNGLVSRANDSYENGALFNTVTYAPVLDEVQLYSVLPLCGGIDNPQKEALNALEGVVIAPTLLEKTGRFIDFEEAGDAGVEIAFTTGEYVGYGVYGNERRVSSEPNNGTVLLTLADVENRKSLTAGRIGGNVDVLLERTDGSKAYYTMALDSTYYLNSKNFKKYLQESGTTLSEYYALEEDITLTGSWKSKVTFTGVLDGSGYKITGLKPSNGSSSGNGGLFWRIQNATFKNLVMEEVVANRNMGAFAYQHVKGTSTFENVYVSFISARFDNNTGDGTNVGQTYTNVGGFFSTRRAANNSGNAVVTNCVVYMPQHMTIDSGYVAGSASYTGTVTISNSTFIGGNGRIAGGTDSGATVKTDATTVICDAVAAHKAIKAKIEADLTMTEKAFVADHAFVELNSANFVEKWSTLTDEVVVLTEDVNLATLSGVTSATNFYGVFDGQNHKLLGVSGALFESLGGSVKNVALMGCEVGEETGDSCAILANTIPQTSTAYIENVYIEATRLSCNSASRASAICKEVLGGLSMKDVVVYCKGTGGDQYATLVGLLQIPTTIVTENCQFINEWEAEAEIANTTDASYQQNADVISGFFSGLTCFTTKASFDEAVAGGTITPTEFVVELLGS